MRSNLIHPFYIITFNLSHLFLHNPHLLSRVFIPAPFHFFHLSPIHLPHQPPLPTLSPSFSPIPMAVMASSPPRSPQPAAPYFRRKRGCCLPRCKRGFSRLLFSGRRQRGCLPPSNSPVHVPPFLYLCFSTSTSVFDTLHLNRS